MPPAGFLRKLGAKARDVFLVPERDLQRFAAGAKLAVRAPPRRKVRRVVFRPRKRAGLADELSRLRTLIEEGGFIWAVIPKKSAMADLKRDLTFHDVLDGALRTDLVDNKTLTFTGTEYGVRLVVRRHLRTEAGPQRA